MTSAPPPPGQVPALEAVDVTRSYALDGVTVEVSKGVQEGERIVVRDADRLSDGDELDL